MINTIITPVHAFSSPLLKKLSSSSNNRPSLLLRTTSTALLQTPSAKEESYISALPFNDTLMDDSMLIDSLLASNNYDNKNIADNQKLQLQVSSSPDLLDPAAILDATVGGGAVIDGSIAVSEDSAAIVASISNDSEDTQQSILDYIDYVAKVSEDNNNNLQTIGTLQEESVANNLLKENTPSVSKILQYTIPAIGIWLCSPVLSMIDTASVGLLSGTAQQAALNPACSVTDFGALLVAFMYTATTNLISAAVQKDNDEGLQGNYQSRTTNTLITSLKLALAVGSGFTILLGASSASLLKLLIGNESVDPAVFSAALRYVRIRSLGMPATVVIGTAQSACLGMKDVKSPLYVLAAAALVNFLGDVCLVPNASPWLGGAAGAAWATVFSQYAALLFFAKWLTSSRDNGDRSVEHDEGGQNVVNITQGIMELTGTSKEGKSRRKEFRRFLSSAKLSRRIRRSSELTPRVAELTITGTIETKKAKKELPKTKGFLNGQMTLRSYLSISNLNKSVAKKFLPFVVPVTTTSVGRISGYIAMAHVASSTLGTHDMAAHQIITSIFFCLAPFVDALNQVAQSLVPPVFEAKASPERAIAIRRTTNNFRKVGAGFGCVLVALTACIPFISQWFTTDPLVLGRVNAAIMGVGLFLLPNGLMCAGEGTLLGQRELKFLRNAYTVFFFAVPGYMLRLKYRSSAGLQEVGVGTMWLAFGAYNVIRTCIWHLRLSQLHRRHHKAAVVR